MKCCLLILALAVMLGVSSGMSLKQKLSGGVLAKRLAQKQMGKRTGDEGPPGGNGGISACGLEALATKCINADYLVGIIAEATGATVEDVWEDHMREMMIYHACPYVKSYMECFNTAEDEDTRIEMVKAVAEFEMLIKCSNFAADIEFLDFLMAITDQTPQEAHYFAIMMQHDNSLLEQCPVAMQNAGVDANDLMEDLDHIAEGECIDDDNRSNTLRSLLRSLQRQLKSSSAISKRR